MSNTATAANNNPITKVPFVDLDRQQAMAMSGIKAAFDRVTSDRSYILGKEAKDFEEAWADYCGTKYAVGCANGTDALVLMLLALKIGPGDEVITVSHTFFATVEAIVSTGATPILIDVLQDTALMDPAKLEAAITPKTKAVIPVHLYGQPCDMDPILEICKKHKLPCLSDAAQAHGSYYKDQPIAKFGIGTSFSFFPGKNLGALGDAGAIVTDDQSFYDELCSLRDHGRRGKKYEHEQFGWNMRIDGLQAAFLNAKLKFLESWNTDRAEIATMYKYALRDLDGIRSIAITDDVLSAYHLYVITCSDRDSLQMKLKAQGIETGVHYPYGVHRQPAWQKKFSSISLPVTEQIADHCLSLPLFGGMTREEGEQVVNVLRQILS